MPPQADSGDFVMNVVGIMDLDQLEEQAQQDGEVRIPVKGEDSRNISGDEGTDSSGAGGGGAMGPLLGVEAGSDMATGGGQGGMLGGLLSGIGKMTLLLGTVVGLLLLLEPIQSAIGGIMRILELAVVPFVAALSPVINGLTQLVTQALAFFRNPSQGIGKIIRSVVESLGNALIGALNQIPGVNVKPLNLSGDGPSPGSGLQRTGGRTEDQTDPDNFLDNYNPFTAEGQANALNPGPREIPALSDEANRQRRQDRGNWFEDLFGGPSPGTM